MRWWEGLGKDSRGQRNLLPPRRQSPHPFSAMRRNAIMRQERGP